MTKNERTEESKKLEYLEGLVRQVLNDLPNNRDWLDPQLERNLRVALNATTPSSNHRALLGRWAFTSTKTVKKTVRKNGLC